MAGIRESLEQAFEASESSTEDKTASPPPAETPPPPSGESETGSTPEPKEVSSTPPSEEPPSGTVKEKPEGGAPEPPPPLEGQSDPKLEKAPGSWKPSAREKWSTVDPVIRAEVYRREAEISRGLNQSTKDATFGRELNEIIAPHQHIFRTVGTDAKTAISTLLQTDMALRMGTPVDKAQRVYNIMSYYGVDAGLLGQLIMGETPPAQQVDPATAQLHQRLAALESGVQSQEEQYVGSIKTELETFSNNPKNEFYRDVRLEMATLLENGHAKDLQDAYDKATWADPEIRKVLLERQAAELSKKVSRKAAEAREASSSINGSGEPVSHQVDPSNLRAVIEAAWDTSGDRL